MHKGNTVYVTKSGKTYHLKDDDCGVSSSIMKGNRPAREITEEQAIQEGYVLCKSCAKEYAEDLRERPFNANGNGCAAVFLLPILGSIAYGIFSLLH